MAHHTVMPDANGRPSLHHAEDAVAPTDPRAFCAPCTTPRWRARCRHNTAALAAATAQTGRTVVIGAGKAGGAMAAAVDALWPRCPLSGPGRHAV